MISVKTFQEMMKYAIKKYSIEIENFGKLLIQRRIF
jgi:hypothetical protein